MKPSLILKLIGTISKTRRRGTGVETRHQGQSTLDECMSEYRRGSAERKCCMAILARLCIVGNLPLHIGSRPSFLKFMRKWEPQWPSISKQSMTRSVEGQSEQFRKDIRREMEGVAAETDVAFITDFWTSPTTESFMTMSMHWITQDCRLKKYIMGTISSGKYWGVAAIPEGIAAMPPIAAILQQYLAMGIAAMLLQHCNCSCIATVLLQYRVAAILPQWGHCCNTHCALQQSTMPQRIAATLRQ